MSAFLCTSTMADAFVAIVAPLTSHAICLHRLLTGRVSRLRWADRPLPGTVRSNCPTLAPQNCTTVTVTIRKPRPAPVCAGTWRAEKRSNRRESTTSPWCRFHAPTLRVFASHPRNHQATPSPCSQLAELTDLASRWKESVEMPNKYLTAM